jgi:hypothetical protein
VTGSAVLWRRVDVPGHDACRLDEVEDGWRLTGTAVYRLADAPARLDYRVTCDRSWRTRKASVRGWVGAEPIAITVARTDDGGWRLNDAPVAGLDDCVHVDFGFTPATNLPQLRRVALAIGEAAEVPVAWLDVPAATLSRLEQRYRRVAATSYDYDAPRFAYRALLEVTPVGFARSYPGLWEMEC